MKVCLLTDKPDHPVLAALPGLLGARHTVEIVDPGSDASFLSGLARPDVFADLYLLKSRTRDSLALARLLAERGGRVVNDPDATELCQSRTRMAEQAHRAGLPFADTDSFGRLSGLVAYAANSPGFRFPCVVKSEHSRRRDLVARVDGLHQLRALEANWAHEPVVVQRLVPHDGWDHRLWVIGSEIFAGKREELSLSWRTLVRKVGRIFNLRIYAVGLIDTNQGPVIVDINAFPGFHGVPGAPEALAGFVRALCAETAVPAETTVTNALAETVRRLIGTFDGVEAAPLSASYLRRKPGRGLVASYPSAHRPLVTSWLSEQVVADPRLPEWLSGVDPVEFQGSWPGVVRCSRIGMTLQAFPADDDLPGLVTAFSPVPGSRLAAELSSASRLVTGDRSIRVAGVRAVPVDYKPGSRCVLRYHVTVSSGGPEGPQDLVFFGKIYRHSAEAVAAHRFAERLWQTSSPAPIARPLALIEELNLALTEVAGGAHHGERNDGTLVLRPDAGAGDADPALRATAGVLSSLHTSHVREGLAESASGARFAARAKEWVGAIARQAPSLADEFARVFRFLDVRLPAATPARLMPIHGTFKPIQLIFCGSARPVMVDFDHGCLGDPALDLGYFLAYLRPSGLFHGEAGARAWYWSARRVFVDAYRQAMRAEGIETAELRGILHRANLFEATLLLKILSSTARKFSVPRLTEPGAFIAEIDGCLERFESGEGATE